MGSANNLFFSSNSDSQTLHRRITPTDEQFDDQQERWNELAEHLRPALKQKTGCDTRTWLQGSYKFGTQVRPVRINEEFDIDLGFYFEWDGESDGGLYGPLELKSFVNEALHSFAEGRQEVKSVSSPKPRCERIRYADNFHIDVPTYHLNEDDARSLANQNDSWEVSDPKAIYLWFKDAFEDAYRGRVRRLVRYLKAWSALKFPDVVSRPSSILLTVLVVDAVLTLGVDILTADDDAFRSIVSEIADRVAKSQSVLNPVNEAEDLALRLDRSDWRKISEMIAELKEQCDRALDSDDEVSAAYVWQEAFEYLFPVPEAGASVLAEKSNLPAPIFVPEIAVSATSKANRNLTYSGQNKIGPIPKGCDIEFRLANTGSLPFGATVTWTVRNEGREAENKNDLGHRVGAGLVAFETSAYRGTHYMDCTVKVGGKVVAMRRVPVEISGVDAPRRNPVNRPAWTRFRR